MDIFVEDIIGEYALCRLPDREKNLIRLPLRELPRNVKPLCVITLRSNGSIFLDSFAAERRINEVTRNLHYKKYKIVGTK